MGIASLIALRAKDNIPPVASVYSQEAAEVDQQFYVGLVALSRNPQMTVWVRQKAKAGAALFKKHWLDAGKAGYFTDPEFKRLAYGNWCGAGCGGGDPVDEIDELCRLHDLGRQQAFAREGRVERPAYT